MPPTPFSDTTEDASVSDLSGLTLTGADGDALIRTSATTIAANPTLHVDAANARVGVGVTTPSTALQVSGTVTATAFAGDGSSLTGISTGSDARVDLSLQALRTGKTNSTPAYALVNSFVDVYSDGTGIASNTNAPRSDSGFVSTINVSSTTITPLASGVSNGQSLTIGSDAAGNANSRFTSSAVGSGWWVLNDDAANQTGKFTWVFTCIQTGGGSGPNFFFGPQKNVEAAGGYAGNAEHAHVSIGGPAASVGDKLKVVYDTSAENTLLGYLDTGSGYGSPLTVTKGANFDSTTLSTLFWFAGCWSDTGTPWIFDVNVVKEISTSSATGEFVSSVQTAHTSVTSMGMVVLYKNNAGTTVLNSDMVAHVSADGGSNYTTVTLVAQGAYSASILQAVATGIAVTPGIQPVYKITFANQSLGSKETQVHGVSLLY